MFREVVGVLAVVLTLSGMLPYIYNSWRGKTRPHMFTWLIWTVMTFITFAAQVVKNGGPGAWTTGVTGLFCLPILVMAVRLGSYNVRRIDGFCLAAAVVAGAAWVVTDDPTISVILVTLIDTVAFIPTMRKSWNKPHEETILNNLTSAAKHFLSIVALTSISVTTALFPAVVGCMNLMMFVVLTGRRRVLGPPAIQQASNLAPEAV